MLDWSDYENEVDPPQKRSLLVPGFIWTVAVGLILFVVFLILPGCATTEPESKVCFMQLMGRTESGLSVVRQACLTEEQFAETQK